MNVEELELLRKKARNSVLIGICITIVLALVLHQLTTVPHLIILGVALGIIITFAISNKPTKDFKDNFKKMFVLKSLQNTFDNLIYNPETGLDESIIRETQMMNMGDRYSSNDFVSGSYKNINIKQADVHIEEKQQTTDSDGHTRTTWVTIFRGRWMIFDFNKKFKADLQVCQKTFRSARVSNWGREQKFQKVMMEDQLFNKIFRIYAQSEHEAFYILTPSLMEKIKKLEEDINGHLLLCFIDNKLHVGIYNNKDSFEHSIFTKINETQVMEIISKDIKLITNFVDKLDLDNDLFIREGV